MADHLHNALSQFRDTMLTAVARLEFQLRDTLAHTHGHGHGHARTLTTEGSESCVDDRLDELQSQLKSVLTRLAVMGGDGHTEASSIAEEILEIKPPQHSKNVVVPSVHATPALSAAVAAMNPPEMNISTGDSAASEMEEEEEVEEEVQEDEGAPMEVEASESEEETPDLRPLKIKGVQYYIDSDSVLYTETEDSYEAVGKWNAATKTIEPLEEEEEEEGVEVEEFEYKGQTYQRDEENNVYFDGEKVGTWNGKRILPV